MPIFDVKHVLKESVPELAASVSPRLDAEVLLAHVLKIERPDLYRYPDKVLSEEESERFQECLARRRKGEPVAYITGNKEFWSLPFKVNKHVLIPRPDTEILVEETIRVCKEHNCRKLLEIGTGSGAVSVALAATLHNITITATDISQQALDTALENATLNGVGDRIHFLKGSFFEPVGECFDVIISNPPYIAESDFDRLPLGVRGFEPANALIAGPEGTEFHRILIEKGRDCLNPHGWILMEFGAGQESQLEGMLKDSHYNEIGFTKDLSGFYRVIKGRKENS